MPEKKNDKIKEEIEAIVFSDARGAEIHSLAKHLKVSGKMVRESIEELAADYKKRGSGLSLAWDEKRVQMATSESFSDSVAKFHQKKMKPL